MILILQHKYRLKIYLITIYLTIELMGIKNFSKIFTAVSQPKIKDLNGKTIAIDAMTELYRSALGAKTLTTLTDSRGRPTIHISVFLANIVEMQKNQVDQIYVFDYANKADEQFHNPLKLLEMKKRSDIKAKAKEKYDKLNTEQNEQNEQNNEELFTDDETDDETAKTDDETDDNYNKSPTTLTKSKSIEVEKSKSIEVEKSKLEKQLFKPSKEMINDIKLILNCLNIKYIDAPKGFEGECVAAYLNSIGLVDGVYSGDTDPIAFGAKVLYRKNPRDKKIYEYQQEDLFKQIEKSSSVEEADYLDLLKICLIAGNDFTEKTTGVGPKTILKKFTDIKLVKSQIKARCHFQKKPIKKNIIIHNEDKEPFKNCQMDLLIDWLVEQKSFSRSRVMGSLGKVKV